MFRQSEQVLAAHKLNALVLPEFAVKMVSVVVRIKAAALMANVNAARDQLVNVPK